MSRAKTYHHITQLVMEKPWAILPGHLAVMRDLVLMRADGVQLSDDEIQQRLGAARSNRSASNAPKAVAVIPIHGSIVPKANMFTDISGATSVADLRSMFADAMNDPDVGSIVFDVDSPGGQVDLIPEFAADIRAQRGRKPMLAVSNTMMASAAYWLASQADEVAVSPSSMTGSIGVFAAHDDLSEAQAKLGVKTTFISAGKYKTEGNSAEPLTEEAQAHIQSLVDDAYMAFTGDVAKGRCVTVADVRNGFGEGRVLTAKAAVSAGLADRVATLEQTISRAASQAMPVGSISASQPQNISTTATTPTTFTITSLPPTNEIEAARGDASFADQANAVLCMADELVAIGRPLTAAKRDQLKAIGDRIHVLVAVNEPSNPDFDLEVRVAAMRARARIAATKLRSS